MQVVVLGGGIAGVSCAQAVVESAQWKNDSVATRRKAASLRGHKRKHEEQGRDQDKVTVVLVCDSSVLKATCNDRKDPGMLATFDVEDAPLNSLKGVDVRQGRVSSIDRARQVVCCDDGTEVAYDKVCVCTGARPKADEHACQEYILGIRDTDSLADLSARLKSASRVVVVGNGGIALELVYELSRRIEVVWVIRDEHIGNVFLDSAAASFLLECRSGEKCGNDAPDGEAAAVVAGCNVFEAGSMSRKQEVIRRGSAMGPQWTRQLASEYAGRPRSTSAHVENLTIEYSTEVASVRKRHKDNKNEQGSVVVALANGHEHTCDFIVSATGVIPNSEFLPEDIAKGDSGEVRVNDTMQTNDPNIYAAGDVATVDRTSEDPLPLWYPMKLWSQARMMGAFCGRCVVGAADAMALGFNFELFTHVTHFFGKKVVLLGLYNGQGLGHNYEVLVRTTPGMEYIKMVIKNGRIVGAILIGDTDLEETCENLINNGIDISIYGDDFLNPDIDLEDYFD